MGLRSSSLAKKNDGTLTWVLHKRDPSQQEISQKANETENENILIRKSYASSTTSEYRERRHLNNHVPRKRRTHVHSNILDYGEPKKTYGYGITDLDDFLSKASIAHPGNIPMVLCTGCLLYQTQLDDHYQTEVALPLGMVVNAVFKDKQWLYVQTPHAEEGYIPYGSCLPLGIVPPPDAARAPCWETQSDVFPRPMGDRRHLNHRHHHHHHHLHDRGEGGDGDDRNHRHRRPPRQRRRQPHRRDWSSVDGGDDADHDDDDGGCDVGRQRLWTTDERAAVELAMTKTYSSGGECPARSITGYGYL